MPYDTEQMFAYHTFNADQIRRSTRIRGAAEALAEIIQENSPASADQTCAIRHVLDAMMTANHAIATEKPA